MSFLIIWQILKFIALLILAVLLLILFVVLCIFFVPIRYKAFAEKQENIIVDTKISWFFKLIFFSYKLKDKKSEIVLKICGWNFIGGKKSKKKKKRKKEKKKPIESKERNFSENEDVEQTKNVDTVEKIEKKEKILEKFIAKEKDSFDEDNTEEKKSIIEQIYVFKEKFDEIYHYPDKNILIKLTKRYVKKIFWALKPKKFTAKVEFGINEPDKVGYILGITQTIITVTQLDIQIKGVFDREVFNGNAYLEGKIYIYKFVLPTLRYVFSKPIWKLVKKAF